MCIQRTQHSCKHAHFRQLPCGNVKPRGNFFSRFVLPDTPCNRRYDWEVSEPCPNCRRELDQRRGTSPVHTHPHPGPAMPQLTSIPESQRPQPGAPLVPGGPPRPFEAQNFHGSIRSRADSYLDPEANAQLAALPGHHQLPASPDSFQAQFPIAWWRYQRVQVPAPLPLHVRRGIMWLAPIVIDHEYANRPESPVTPFWAPIVSITPGAHEFPVSPVSTGRADSRMVLTDNALTEAEMRDISQRAQAWRGSYGKDWRVD